MRKAGPATVRQSGGIVTDDKRSHQNKGVENIEAVENPQEEADDSSAAQESGENRRTTMKEGFRRRGPRSLQPEET